jgi:hypothetical protein
VRHISEAIRDMDDAALQAAVADREGAWQVLLDAMVAFESTWQFENDLREDEHRRRLERIKFLHDLSESAAEASDS